MNGSYKFPKFILPTVRDQLKTGGSIKIAALSVASWMRFLGQAAEQGSPVPVRDPIADTLIRKAKEGGDDAAALLSLRKVFGDLSDHDRFRTEVCACLKQLYAEGAVSTIQACLR